MTYHVRTLHRAQQDVDAIVHWIAVERQSPQGAATWLHAYEQAAAALSNSPQGYPFAPENEHVDLDIRQFLFKTRRGRIYRGLFTVEIDEVLILRVRGPGQAPVEPHDLE